MPLARFARLDADGGVVTPGPRRSAHAPAVRGLARGRARPPPARRGLPRDPRRRRRDPVDRRRDARGDRGGAGGARPALARRDAPPRRHDDRGEVRLRPRPRDGAAAPRRSRTSWARRARSTSCRRSSAPTPSRPSSARGRTAPRPTSGSVIEEQLPGVAAQGRAASCDVFCEQGVFTRRPEPADPRRPRPATGWRSGSTPTSSPRPAARSWRPSSGPLSADHLHTPCDAGVDALAAGRRRRLADGRDAAAGDDVVPDGRRRRAGPPVHRRRRPRRPRHRLQPRHLAHAHLPLVMTVACLEMRLSPEEALAAVTINAAHAVGVGDQAGSLEPGKQADLVDLAGPARSAQLPYWAGRPRGTVVKRGRIVHERRRRAARPARGQACLPRDSRRTVVVSSGRLEVVTASLAWIVGSAPISWRNCLSASSHSASSSQTGIGTTIFGSSWATSAAARVAVRAPPIGTQATSTRPMSASFSSVSWWPMSPRWIVWMPVELGDERDLPAALRALRVVAVGPHARQQDVVDLVLARARRARTRARGWSGWPSRRRATASPPSSASGASSGWLNVTTSPVMPRPVGPTIGGIGVVDDDGVLAAQADAGPSVPGELHAADSRTGRLPRDHRWPRCPGPVESKGPEAPAQSAPPVRGREDGTC